MTTIDRDFIRVIPTDLVVPGGRNSVTAKNISDQIREMYLGSRPVSEDTLEEMIYVIKIIIN